MWQANNPNSRRSRSSTSAASGCSRAAQYPPQSLEGHSFTDITNSIGANDNTIGVYVDASAAVLTKDICAVTGQQPAATCRAVAGVNTPAGVHVGRVVAGEIATVGSAADHDENTVDRRQPGRARRSTWIRWRSGRTASLAGRRRE